MRTDIYSLPAMCQTLLYNLHIFIHYKLHISSYLWKPYSPWFSWFKSWPWIYGWVNSLLPPAVPPGGVIWRGRCPFPALAAVDGHRRDASSPVAKPWNAYSSKTTSTRWALTVRQPLCFPDMTKVTQCEDSNLGWAASKAHTHNHSSEVPLEDSDVTHPYNLAEVLFPY